jgi:hypothetical protein
MRGFVSALVGAVLLVPACAGDLGSGNVGPTKATLTVAVSGQGRVRSTPDGVDCPAACSASFDRGSTITLRASPDAGQRFSGWGGACSGTADCSIPLTGDVSVTARFEAGPPPPTGSALLSVAFTGGGSGRATSSPAGIDCGSICSASFPRGTVITVTATPNPGSTLVGYGGACSGTTCSLVLMGDVNVFVHLESQAPPPPPPSCAGLGFGALPPTQIFTTNPGFGRATVCEPGMADSAGTLGFPVSRAGMQGGFFAVVGPDGRFRGSRYEQVLNLNYTAQPDGFTGTAANPAQSAWATHHIDRSGSSLHTGQTFFGPTPWQAPDPGGGIVLAGPMSNSQTAARRPQIVSEDANANTRALGSIASPESVFGIGMDVAGNALVITNGTGRFGTGSISAQWFDRFAAPLTGEFVLLSGFEPGRSTWFETAPLIGGGLAVRRMDGHDEGGGRFSVTSRWLVVVTSGAPSVSPAPDWLASRNDTLLAIVRGGRAYALLPEEKPNGECAQSIEVFTPGGQSCGAQEFRRASGSCRTLGIRVGLDGTILQQTPPAFEQGAGSDSPSCSWLFWSGALH